MQIKNQSMLKVILIGVLVILFALSIILALVQKTPPAIVSDNQDVIIIKGNKKEVQTRNFFKDPVEEIGDTLALAKTKDFDIVYFKKDSAFLITLASQPVSKARDLAENEFLKQLAVDIGQACSLKVTVRIPYSVNSDLSGKDYGLSFCPNAVSF